MWNFQLMPEQASSFAPDYDLLFWATTALTILFTVLVFAMIVVLAAKYRRGAKADRTNPIDHNTFLELSWSVIPLFLALIMFAWAAWKFVETRTPPKDAMEVFVIGKQWMWHVQHENGVRENNTLTVPVNKPVKLTMISQDVIHSFFIPQFRIKQDVVPGRYTSQWFLPTKIGTYNLFCTEYCGTSHSEMGGYVRVLSESDYARWLANGGDNPVTNSPSMVDLGRDIWNKNACGTCHGVQDSSRGPSLYGLIGRSRKFTDGSSTTVDRAYIRESLYDPYHKIVQGYENTMPAYTREQITEDQVVQLFEYIRSLGEAPNPSKPMAMNNNRNQGDQL
jgi:cytochrome c oxidase subunit 2